MSDRLRDLASGRAEPKPRGLAAWFAGRARRREYWAFVGATMVAIMILGALGMAAASLLVSMLLTVAFIRRLHDLGHSGWWAPVINLGATLMAIPIRLLIPGDGGAMAGALPSLIAIVALGVLAGEAGRNDFGEPPGRRPAAGTHD